MQRIWPSASFAPSKSKAPYELRFRNSFFSEIAHGAAAEVKEWVFAPPRAFLFDQVGANGNVYELSSPELYAVYLEAILLEDETLVPRTTVPKNQQRTRSLVFHITNRGASSGFKLAGGCVPQERFDYALSLESPIGTLREIPCIDRDFRCEIKVPIDGWDVAVSATHDLYKQPERVCEIARRFLDRYTVKRDNIELEYLKAHQPKR